MILRWLICLGIFSTALCSATADHNWPQFRGPGGRGIADDDAALPETWSTTENVAWKTPIPGRGWSSPVIWGDRILLTSVVSSVEPEAPKKGLYFGGNRKAPADEHRWMVYCLDWETGRLLWEKEVLRSVPASDRHLKNSYASETPVTDGQRFYVYFGNVGLFCFDFDGKLLWSKEWTPVKTRYGWGTAASPVLHREFVIVVNDNDDQSYITALDKKTGETRWRAERAEASNWASPFVWENDARTEIVTAGTNKVRSYDLNGKVLWEFGGMSSITIPTPFSAFGMVFISSGYVGDDLRPVYAVKPGGNGDISLKTGEASNAFVAWSQRQAASYNPSSLVYGNYYYTLLDRGFFTCHEAKTGHEVYGKQRIDPEAGAFTASPWAYNNKVFCLSEDGDAFVIQAGPEFKLLRRNRLEEMCMATPAIARDSLIIRTASQVYRIRKGR